MTRPPAWRENMGGGLSIIPRRGYESHFCNGSLAGPLDTREKLLSFAARFPAQLSAVLGTVHPTVSKAQTNALTMVAAPGAVTLSAYKNSGAGQAVRDDAATEEIPAFLDSLGGEIGGLHGLLTIGTMALLHDPPWSIEGIAGPRGGGLSDLGMVSGSTIEFGRGENGKLLVYQRQQGAQSTNGRVELSQETFFWRSFHADANNPYGRAVFSAAVSEALKDINFQQDLADGVHNAAWHRLIYKYSLQQFYDVARNLLGLPESDKDADGNTTYPAQDWVNARLKEVGDYLAGLRPDDNIIADSAGGVDTLKGGDFSGLEPIIEAKEYRLVRALGELPTTMGLPKTVGQNHTTAEWAMQADHYMTLRHLVTQPIIDVMNLHFRLQGRPLIVKAEYKEIRASDLVQEENAKATKTATVLQWVDRGYITDEDAALMLTGSGLPAGYKKPAPPATEDTPDDDAADLPNEGTTREERDAQREQR